WHPRWSAGSIKVSLEAGEQSRLAVSADAQEITSLSGGGRLTLISSSPVRLKDAPDDDVIAADPRGRYVATLHRREHRITLWDSDLRGQFSLWMIDNGCSPSAVAAAPTGRLIAVGCQEGGIAFLNATGVRLPGPPSPFRRRPAPAVTAVTA